MKSKKMMSLLTAAALSGGLITTAVVAPSIVAATESMADQYQPSYAPGIGSTDEVMSYAELKSHEQLPSGTRFYLENSADYLVQEGIYAVVKDDGDIAFTNWTGPGSKTILASGTTITIPITVVYPDHSVDVIAAKLTLTPPNNQGFDVSYIEPSVVQGTTATFTPAGLKLPSGTSIAVIDSATTLNLREAGWEFSTGENGALTASAPEDASGPVHIQLSVVYPDGTSELAAVKINVAAPVPPHAETYELTYPVGAITQGDSAAISPTDAGLPAGTKISLVDNAQLQDLITAGWTIQVGADHSISYTAPRDAEGQFSLNLLVNYPDGTEEETTATIQVDPSNQAGDHDVSYPDTTILAGGSAIITPVITALPAGTSITLVDDKALEAARHAGWNLTISDDGKITASTQESTVAGAVVNILVSYPDGTSQVTTVKLLVLPKAPTEDSKEEAPVKPRPAPWSSRSFFGSS